MHGVAYDPQHPDRGYLGLNAGVKCSEDGGATWVAFQLVGADVSFLDAMAIEALLSTLRSIAVFVPAAIGVQEGGYVALAQLFGLPAEMGLAVSLLKRAREIVLGIPALLYWQSVEGRAALRSAQP